MALSALVAVVGACGSDTPTATRSMSATTTVELTEIETTVADTTVDTTDDTTDTTDEVTTTTVDPTAEAFQWRDVGTGVQEGFLDVPLDHDDPDGEQVSLYVVRRRAPEETRIGSLLVNPGGPGSGGTFLAAAADQIYGAELLAAFDIIGWDPRGTGDSEPFIDCVDDYDPYFGIETGANTLPEEAIIQDAARQFAAGCVERSGELLDHITTVDAARDMDAIRAALGEDEISYFGFSYGTQLGATWATLFPDTVRAAALDGAIDPTSGRVQGLIAQAGGFERTLGLFLADCTADPTCPFNNGGDAEGAFDALLASLEQDPIPTAEGRPELVDGVFELGVAQALYVEAQWPELASALAAAQDGDGSEILALYDQYYGRGPDGTYANDVEGYFAITCADDPAVGGLEAALAERPQFAAASRIGFTQAYELVRVRVVPGTDGRAGVRDHRRRRRSDHGGGQHR